MSSIIHNLVYSNFLISIGAASLLGSGYLILNKEINYYAIGFTFCSTLLMYNLQRIHKLKYQSLYSDNHRHKWIIKNKNNIQLIIVICALILAMLIPFFHWKELIGLAFLGLISFFYSYRTQYGNLRSLPGMKIFWIALVWAFTVSVFTVGAYVSQRDIYLYAYSFSFILAITIPFDIRDMEYDDKKFKTIPQLIGEFPARIFSFMLILISYCILLKLNQEFSIFLSLVYGIFGLLTFGSTSKRKELYFSGIMDFTLVFAFICHFLYFKLNFFHF